MPGESPLNMMRPQRRQVRTPAAAVPRRRLWPVVAAVCILIALAGGWCGLWYYAAAVADRTLAGWVAREAAAGRVYSCGSQGISGFPFRIQARCVEAAAQINSNQPPFVVSAKDVTFAAQVYHPTVLVGQVTGPLTLAVPSQPPSFIANWSGAQMSVSGLPPEPESVSVTFDNPRVDHVVAANATTVFAADHAEIRSRIVGGSAGNNPVIDTLVRFAAATAPTLHPLLAAPLQGDIDAVLRGFKDLSPKPWAERFREMQAAGGNIEIKSMRLERSDAIIVGTGTLTVNEHGRLDGLIRIAIAGIGNIVPLLGVDRLIGRGIDRLAGSGQSPQGLGALDRLVPGLSGVVRDTTNASLIDNLTKMGQPTDIDKKPAIVLPLRFSDGSVYLGMIPLGDVPPLF
ncbi:MAG TPA: DUF2125 domain-containing protein [Xanthobacteraceae bacterium]|nr:DUF2125 domain-containing protein [Xanthobacteraceae bacterium]